MMKYDIRSMVQNVLTVSFIYGVYNCKYFLFFIIFCLFVTYILFPCKKFLENYTGSWLASVILTFGVFGWIALSLWKTLGVWRDIVQYRSLITLPLWEEMILWVSKIQGFSYEAWFPIVEKGLKLLIQGGWGVLFFVLTPFFVFFFLTKFEKWGPELIVYSSVISEKTPHRLRLIHQTLSHYLKGQLIISGILAFYYIIGLKSLGVTSALTLGFLTGLGSFIPYLGFLYGLLMALSLAAASQVSVSSIYSILVLYGLGYAIETSVLFPYFIGRALGIPAVGMISLVFISGTLFGFFGVIFVAPLAALVKVFFNTNNLQKTIF